MQRDKKLDNGGAKMSAVERLRHYFQVLKGQIDIGEILDVPQDVHNCDEMLMELNKLPDKINLFTSRRREETEQVGFL